MKLKTLNNVDEGELFFVHVNTEDGPDLRSYIKGKPNANRTHYHCECSTGDTWEALDFPLTKQVWA